ncbi:MAG: hypothetical protein AB1391_00925 [Candidatus Micrarchaeota archaeon]
MDGEKKMKNVVLVFFTFLFAIHLIYADPMDVGAEVFIKPLLVFVFSILFAIILETPVYWYFLRGKESNQKILLAGIGINAISVTLFWLLTIHFMSIKYNIRVLDDITFAFICEFAIFILEAFVLAHIFKLNLKKSLIVSFCANLLSAVVGSLLLSILFLLLSSVMFGYS